MTVHGQRWQMHWEFDDVVTDQADIIMHKLLPEWAEKFLASNKKYAKVGNDLGPAGVFPDIHRKVQVLRSIVWDDEPAGREPLEEIINDLIGHLFLMRAIDILTTKTVVVVGDGEVVPARFATPAEEQEIHDDYSPDGDSPPKRFCRECGKYSED